MSINLPGIYQSPYVRTINALLKTIGTQLKPGVLPRATLDRALWFYAAVTRAK